MGHRKLLLLFFSVGGIYLLARGGVTPLFEDFPNGLTYLLEPLRVASAFDIAIGVVSLILLAWAFLLGDEGRGISRTQLLAGIAFGSAVMAALITGVNLFAAAGATEPRGPGILAIIALLHGGVGTGAALLMLARRESRRASTIPVLTNTVVTSAAAILLCGSYFL